MGNPRTLTNVYDCFYFRLELEIARREEEEGDQILELSSSLSSLQYLVLAAQDKLDENVLFIKKGKRKQRTKR